MNTAQLKTYAPEARKAFIAAVSAQAARIGITSKGNKSAHVQGDVLLVDGQAFPRSLGPAREKLLAHITANGFHTTLEAIAYTWFNRFVAIRFMELHGYLEHGYRVLSHPDGQGLPEILDHVADLDLNGLDRDKAVELKLDGTQDEELYRLLLKAQCNALHQAMPFLFERIGDETELLLPDNLLHTDSLIRQLVEQVDENLWQEIEIIGWLYQFYISEKKDEVIGNVVKSEDIPAATQLFTPNWIVKYMVQNSLGAQWLATYPNSPIKEWMEYYIEPADQSEDVKVQLAVNTPSTLNPEEMTLIDPASGSGHILVEAYELFKAIYLERGYRQLDVAQLILENNLFGLDIDQRAAQLTGFALMMKGRADDRRLFERGVKLNVMAMVDSAVFDAEGLAKGVELAEYGLQGGDLAELKRLFEHTTTFGSLIRVPEGLAGKLPPLKKLSEATSLDLFVSDALKHLRPLVQQTELLAAKYDAVVANPPYMGGRGMYTPVKKFAKDYFPDAKENLFACFIERGCTFSADKGQVAMVTMQSWMFLSSFEKLRKRILREKTIRSMAHLGARAFGSIPGEVVQTTAFVLQNQSTVGYRPAFFRLLDGSEEVKRTALTNGQMRFDAIAQDAFAKIPGSPIAYWVSEAIRAAFSANEKVSQYFAVKKGMDTGDNDGFLRRWFEIDFGSTSVSPGASDKNQVQEPRWFPYNKGGGFRKWYGNHEYFIDWHYGGRSVREHSGSTLRNEGYYFRLSVSWSDISSSSFGVRLYPEGFIHDNSGPSVFGAETSLPLLLAYMAGPVPPVFLSILNPTLHYQIGNVADLPWLVTSATSVFDSACHCIDRGNGDWNAYERSWVFQILPILTTSVPMSTLETSYTAWIRRNRNTIAEMKRLEEENNRFFIDAYGLADELTHDVPIEQITLTVNPAYRYGGKLTEEEQWTRFHRLHDGPLQPGRTRPHLRTQWQ